MRTSIATVSLSGDLDEKLQAIAEAGYDGVEIFENDFLTFDGGPADVGQRIRDLHLSCVTLQPFRDFEGMPEPQRSRLFARAERKFAIMKELGTDLLMVCSNVSPAALGGIDRAAKDLRELGERAAAHGLRIGFEALAWGRHISDHRDAWEAVRRADHPAVGLVLDSYHTLTRGIPVDSIRAIPGDRIFLVQVADAPNADMDLLSLSRHFRCMPGQGDLPLAEFFDALEATGYQGPLSLEIFNDQFRSGGARRVALDGQRSLIALADRNQSVTDATANEQRRTRCAGIDFIEFAVDGEIERQLTSLFTHLGFSHIGAHKSKQVSLWRQGDINLVVNAETDGFAHAHYITHGPSVCAMAMKVGDVDQAMARSRRLKLQPFSQPVAPDELSIPAIRGVGGSLIYLVGPDGNDWASDFALDASVVMPVTGIGLTGIDHVSQTMSYGEMLSWRLSYTALFDLEKSPEVDIADPGGLVQSQPLQAPSGVRLVLNSSQSPNTQSSRFVYELFGAGVQHIAFASDDIFATVRAMEANGLATLPIPENYYDDLDTRFAIEPGLLDDLRAHNVLYDEDGDGAYLQIYTRTFADRFFFEVVERRNYAGFGANNAAIRLAAQARGATSAHMAM